MKLASANVRVTSVQPSSRNPAIYRPLNHLEEGDSCHDEIHRIPKKVQRNTSNSAMEDFSGSYHDRPRDRTSAQRALLDPRFTLVGEPRPAPAAHTRPLRSKCSGGLGGGRGRFFTIGLPGSTTYDSPRRCRAIASAVATPSSRWGFERRLLAGRSPPDPAAPRIVDTLVDQLCPSTHAPGASPGISPQPYRRRGLEPALKIGLRRPPTRMCTPVSCSWPKIMATRPGPVPPFVNHRHAFGVYRLYPLL